MNPEQLLRADGAKSGIYICGNCKCVRANCDHAEKCCVCMICKKPIGKESWYGGRGGKTHQECRQIRHEETQLRMMDKAEIAEDYDGMFFHNGSYYSDPGMIPEEFENQEDAPEFAYCCEKVPFVLNIDHALENEGENHHEEIHDSLRGLGDLYAAVKKFNDANKETVSYDVDYTRKARVM